MKVYLGLVLIACFFLTACPTSTNNPTTTNYYQGTEGVRMKFTDNSPPTRLYYYGSQNIGANTNVGAPGDNDFEVNLELKNMGANYAFGVLYFSGYNPNMIYIPPYDLTVANTLQSRYGTTCNPTVGKGNNGWSFFLNCNIDNKIVFNGGTATNQGGYGSVSGDLGYLLGKAGIHWFDNSSLYTTVNLGCPSSTATDKTCSYDFGIDYKNFKFEDGYYGKLAFDYYSKYFKTTYGEGVFPDDYVSGHPFFLAGNNYYYPGGEMSYVNAPSTVTSFPVGLDDTDQPIVATACYIYTTHATPSVCIDRYPYDGSRKVCTPSTQSWPKSQGAPVAITRIEQENTPEKILFTIHIKNVGTGQVYDPRSINKCNPWNPTRTTERDKNVVQLIWISLGTVGYENMVCHPDYWVRLNNGEGVVTCEYALPANTPSTAYKDNLVVELTYGYSQTIQKSVHIKRVT
jgi:hypothetical protein